MNLCGHRSRYESETRVRINAAPSGERPHGSGPDEASTAPGFRAQLLKRAWGLIWFVAPWFGIAASIELAGIDLWLAIITPDYDGAGETISQMQGVNAAYSAEARLSLLVYSLLVIPFTIRATRLPGLRQPWVKVMMFGLWAHVVMGIAAAGFQSEYHRIVFLRFTANNIHDAAGHVFFVVGILGVIGTALAMDRLPEYRRLKIVSTIAAAIMILTGLMFITRALNDFMGIHERIGFAAYLTWVALMSIRIEVARRRNSRGDRENVPDGPVQSGKRRAK